MTKKMPRRPWTLSEIERAKAMRAEGHSYLEIDRRLNRRPGSSNLKLTYPEQPRHNPDGLTNFGSIRAPDHVLAERDARKDAADRRDLTATFCGDPPPGYSARDRRQT